MCECAGFFEWLSWINLNNGGNCGVSGANLNNGLTNANWNIESGSMIDSIYLDNSISIIYRNCNMYRIKYALGERP